MSEWHCKKSIKNKTTGHYQCGNQGQCPFEKIERLRKSANKKKATIDTLQAEVERLSQQVCDECSPDDYGWKHNRVDGKHPCTCMTEAEPYQLLQAANEKLTEEVDRADELINTLYESGCLDLAREELVQHHLKAKV